MRRRRRSNPVHWGSFFGGMAAMMGVEVLLTIVGIGAVFSGIANAGAGAATAGGTTPAVPGAPSGTMGIGDYDCPPHDACCEVLRELGM